MIWEFEIGERLFFILSRCILMWGIHILVNFVSAWSSSEEVFARIPWPWKRRKNLAV